MEKKPIEETIRDIIKREYPGQTGQIELNTPLISSRLIDSFHTMLIVRAIEDEFGIELEVSEISEKYLDTVERMTAMVKRKVK